MRRLVRANIHDCEHETHDTLIDDLECDALQQRYGLAHLGRQTHQAQNSVNLLCNIFVENAPTAWGDRLPGH